MLGRLIHRLSSLGKKPGAGEKEAVTLERECTLEQMLRQIAQKNADADFFEDLHRITSTESKFWYDYARALSTLPETGQLDLRPNGRLAAAVVAIERAAACDPNHIAIWAERLVIQRYLAHGLSAATNALSMTGKANTVHTARTNQMIAQFKQTLDDAVLKFPDDEWFRIERQEAYGDFGWQAPMAIRDRSIVEKGLR